jgi:hypothetical protein
MERYNIHFENGGLLVCKSHPENVKRFMEGEPAYQSGIFQSLRGKSVEINRDKVLYVECRT